MKVKLMFLVFALFGLIWVQGLSAATVTLWDLFPDTQGENNFWALAYNPSSGYRELNDGGEYLFNTPGHSWNIPYLTIQDDPNIVTHPYGYELGGFEHTVLKCIVPSDVISVNRITGGIDPWDGGDIQFYIKKGNNILYETTVTSSTVNFDLSVNIYPGDEVYFGVSPIDNSYNDTTFYWATIEYTQAPIPPSIVLLSGGLGMLAILRKKFFSL